MKEGKKKRVCYMIQLDMHHYRNSNCQGDCIVKGLSSVSIDNIYIPKDELLLIRNCRGRIIIWVQNAKQKILNI